MSFQSLSENWVRKTYTSMWLLFLFFGNADELLAVRICRELLSSTTTAKQSVLLRQDSRKVPVQIHHPSFHSYWRVSWPHGTCGHLQPFQLLVSFQHLGNGYRFINCKPILMFNISWSAIELIEAQSVTAVYRSICLGEKTVKIYLDMVFFPKVYLWFPDWSIKIHGSSLENTLHVKGKAFYRS